MVGIELANRSENPYAEYITFSVEWSKQREAPSEDGITLGSERKRVDHWLSIGCARSACVESPCGQRCPHLTLIDFRVSPRAAWVAVAKYAANNLLRVSFDKLGGDRVAKLVDGIAVLLNAIHDVQEFGCTAQLNPMVMQGVVGDAGSSVRAKQRDGR